MCSDDIPESRGMVCLEQVGEFMHNDVINYEHRCFDQSPVQVHVVLWRALKPKPEKIPSVYRGSV